MFNFYSVRARALVYACVSFTGYATARRSHGGGGPLNGVVSVFLKHDAVSRRIKRIDSP